MAAHFLDTNVLIYAFTRDARAGRAQELLGQGCILSTQVLNEFVNVARRKLGFDWDEVETALGAIRVLAQDIVPLDIGVHERGLAIARDYRLQLFDGLIVAAALAAGCSTLWSEDMHDGLRVERTLVIANPFREASRGGV